MDDNQAPEATRASHRLFVPPFLVSVTLFRFSSLKDLMVHILYDVCIGLKNVMYDVNMIGPGMPGLARF
jgi:hypothetical protein